MTTIKSSQTKQTERTYSGISLSQRVAQRRECFIDAGIDLFGTIGYNATTMRKLVSTSGLTNRYFYESFDSMEDLLIACYESLMNHFRDTLQQVLHEAKQEKPINVKDGLLCFFQAMQDPKFAKITHSEVLGISAKVDTTYNRKSADFAALLMSYVEENEAIHIDPAEKQIIGAALVGAVTHAAMVWVKGQYEQPIDTVVEAARKIFEGTLVQLAQP